MPNPTLPVTEISALQAPDGLTFIEARSTIQFLDSDDKAAFLAHLGVSAPAAAASQAEMETGTEAALRSMSPLRVKQAIAARAPAKPLSDQTLAADFATTSAAAWDFSSPPESPFTPVPCVSGKSYSFVAEMRVKWATALASGALEILDTTFIGPLTIDSSLSFMRSDVSNGSISTGGLGSLANVTESTTWLFVTIAGFFKATASEDFNLGVNIAGWDSGDVVTFRAGSKLRVDQLD